MIKFVIILVSLFAFTNALGQSSSKNIQNIKQVAKKKRLRFVKLRVVVYKNDTLGKILRRFVRDDSIINRKEAMVQRTLNSNPQVKDWRNLEPGSTLNLYLDYKFIDRKKMRKFRKDVKKVAKKLKKAKSKEQFKAWNVYYMASYGTFTQENSEIARVSFRQNSPVTLGTMYTYYPKNSNFTVASSVYLSYLVAASSNVGGTGENVDVPPEIGLNSYYQRQIPNTTMNVYGGLDYEQFNTFNLQGIESSDEVFFDQNQLGFATVGMSYSFQLGKHAYFVKGSISQSIFSSRSVGYADDPDSTAYSGNKVMGFLMTKIGRSFFVSSLFKYHTLTGPSEVTALRFGVGCGYFF